MDSYAFVTVNTGEGNDFHPLYRAAYPKEKRRSAIRIGGIPQNHILEESFWYLLFEMRYQPSSLHGPDLLYEVLLPFLSKGARVSEESEEEEEEEEDGREFGEEEGNVKHPPVKDFTFSKNLDEQIRLGKCGDFETIQRSGTCFFRVILSALKYCCKRAGLCLEKRKQLTYAFRLILLLKTQIDLDRLRVLVEEEMRALKEKGILERESQCEEQKEVQILFLR